MTLRTDHISGSIAILFGIVVIVLGGELPVGSLSFPGAGMWPKLLALLLIAIGIAMIVSAGDGEAFPAVPWSDLLHAGPVFVCATVAIRYFHTLGFIISMALLMFALVLFKRRPILHAAVFAAGTSLATYAVFTMFLRVPLPRGLFGWM